MEREVAAKNPLARPGDLSAKANDNIGKNTLKLPHSSHAIKQQRAAVSPSRSVIYVIDSKSLRRVCIINMLRSGLSGNRIVGLSCVDEISAGSGGTQRKVGVVVLSTDSAEACDPAILAALETLNERLPAAPIVLLSDRDQRLHLDDLFVRGVRGYLQMSIEPRLAIDAIRFILSGGTYVPPEAVAGCGEPREQPVAQGAGHHKAASLPIQGPTPDTATQDAHVFTERQRDVLRLINQGMPNKVMAYQLQVSEATVKMHVRNIMKKLGVTNRTQVACMYSKIMDKTS